MLTLIICICLVIYKIESLLTCDAEPCTITPDKDTMSDDIIVCASNINECIIDCSIKKDQCTRLNMYSSALTTKIYCNNENSCYNTNINIGYDIDNNNNIIPYDTILNTVQIFCDSKSSCKQSNINIYSKINYGVSIDAQNSDAFNKGTLFCNTHGPSCVLKCVDNACIDSEFICQDANCKCFGNTCPNIILQTISPTKITITPTIETSIPTNVPTKSSISPTVYPTKNSNTPTNKPSFKPTFNPSTITLNPTLLPTKSSKTPSITPTSMPTNITSQPTLFPTLGTNNPSTVPSKIPSYQPSGTPTQYPTKLTLNPTIAPTTTRAPTVYWIENIEPKPFETIICNNSVDFCNINCINCGSVKVYSGASNTNINCYKRSCMDTEFYIGIPPLFPNGMNINHFNGNKDQFNINCVGESSCFDSFVHISGNFINGVNIQAKGAKSFYDSILECDLKSQQSCELTCIDASNEFACELTKFVCEGGNCKCVGDTCPKVKIFTPNPTLVPSSLTLAPTTAIPTKRTQSPVIMPTPNTRAPTTMNPTVVPTMSPTNITTIPTKNPSINPTLITYPPTYKKIVTYSPKAGDTIVCPNYHETCIIDCAAYQQCKRINNQIVKAYIGSPNVIINCNNVDSCFGAEFYIGIPKNTPIPPKYNINHFNGIKNKVHIHCNKDGSCKQTLFDINGEYINNVYISVYGNDGIKQSTIFCNNNNYVCQLECPYKSSCIDADFNCNSFECMCNGISCPLFNTNPPTSLTANPTTYSPTINTYTPTNNPIIYKTNSPTLTEIIYINNRANKKFYNTIYFYIITGGGLLVIICLNITFCYRKRPGKEGHFEPLVLKRLSSLPKISTKIAIPDKSSQSNTVNRGSIRGNNNYNTFDNEQSNLEISESWGI